ncbi:hypothetical protein OPKNFCMD_3671 [Methylobacterium crusticola]|uniref:Uncharacterized protein n=1 Tax=Methylobacterium crusticola TaxID=1697972 RepID=A0ABQ4QZS5_9HYPH|nr:hypothetical protein [Methylobacterium crusticola]GJD50922.1 hypothetical protein OPKNFCMD_3671 [Methylobacterium crusticola]
MKQGQLRARLNADKTSLTLGLPGADGNLRTLDLASAKEVEQLIRVLCEYRNQMVPGVPATLDSATVDVDETGGVWAAAAGRHQGLRPVFFRHATFGWLGFLLTDENAETLAEALTAPLQDDAPRTVN